MAFGFPFRALALASCFALFSATNAGRCSKPSVRHEWNSMTKTEQTNWINAVKCLAKLPHDPSLSPSVDPALSIIPSVNTSASHYDDMVYVHMDLNIRIHGTGYFLPWHRAYVSAFESVLKKKCGYNGTQPYWDWSLHTEDFPNSPVFNPDPTSGLGTNGDPNNNWELSDGAFSRDFLLAYPTPHRLRRNFTIQQSDPATDQNKFANATFTKEEVNKMVTGFMGDFNGFVGYFAPGAHAAVHFIVGADLFGTCTYDAPPSCIGGPKWASNDPMFFMHHAMVDKVWYDWQHNNEANFWAFEGGTIQATNLTESLEYPNGLPPNLSFDSKIPADGMFNEYTIYDMMNTTGGTLCYVYA